MDNRLWTRNGILKGLWIRGQGCLEDQYWHTLLMVVDIWGDGLNLDEGPNLDFEA